MSDLFENHIVGFLMISLCILQTCCTFALQGPLVNEVYEQFSPWASMVTRMYKDADYVEVEYTVGPIPIKSVSNLFVFGIIVSFRFVVPRISSEYSNYKLSQ